MRQHTQLGFFTTHALTLVVLGGARELGFGVFDPLMPLARRVRADVRTAPSPPKPQHTNAAVFLRVACVCVCVLSRVSFLF